MSDRPEKEERTEDATPRRREEARDKGQVAFSSESVAAAMLAAAVGSFLVTGPALSGALGELVGDGVLDMSKLARTELEVGDASAAMVGAARRVVPLILLLLAPVLFVGALVGFGQVGVRFAPKAIEFDPEKVNPASGAKRVFGTRGAMRTLLGILKLVCVGGVVAAVAWHLVPETSNLAGSGARPTLRAVGFVVQRAVLAGVVTFFALSLIDLIHQRMQLAKDLRMTRKEVRDEARNTEGDPLVRSRIRQVQRELASRRMMSAVPDATVVVTNPTHFAVALRYDDASSSAPVVVAKGVDHVALRIREIAGEAKVVVHEEPPLARALHRTCEIGDPIPSELFEAVARVLAYVYRIRGESPSAAAASSIR